MDQAIKIRPYNDADAKRVAALMDDFHDFLISIDPNGRFRRLPGYGEYALKEELENTKNERGTIYVACDGDNIIGFCVGFILKDFREEDLVGVFPAKRGRVEELYIDPTYRGRGVATELMKSIEGYLSAGGCEYLFVGVHAFNQNAHKLYEHLGYKDVGIDLMKELN